jgi:hypothetical protein
MARNLIQDLLQTLRNQPVRSALAALLLLATTIYVCTDHSGTPVSEIGEEATPTLDASDDSDGFDPSIEQASVDETEAASLTRIDGRDRFHDSQVVAALAELSDEEKSQQARVLPVSGQIRGRGSNQKPVWLLGRLIED